MNVVDHETSNRHLALLNQLLYSKDYMQLAKKAEEEDAHSFLKDKHRRERLLLVSKVASSLSYCVCIIYIQF